MKHTLVVCGVMALVGLLSVVPASAGSITGTVTADVGGAPPIGGALVRTEGDPSYTATATTDGAFTISAPSGTYSLLSGSAGFTPQRVQVVVSGGVTTQNIALRPVNVTTPSVNLPAALEWGEPPSSPVAPGEAFPIRFADAAAQPVSGAPAIAGWTETIKPNETFTLTGSRFTTRVGADAGTDTIVWVWARTSDTTGTLRQARVWSVDQYTIMATMPEDIPFGMYLVWVENANGASSPVCINRTIARWVGPLDNTAYAGQTKRVFGRNLSQNHGLNNSFVYIQPAAGGAFTLCEKGDVNPYAVEFTVPVGTPNGNYKVYLHNGNGGQYGWGDPLDLTVQTQWVRGGYVCNLSPSGVDDTASLQSALNIASAQPNGGTVQLAAGSYIIKNTMTVPANVQIKGAGKDVTFMLLQLASSGIHTVITLSGDHIAWTDLTFRWCNTYGKPGYCNIAGTSNYCKFTNFKMKDDPPVSGDQTIPYAFSVGGLVELDRCEMYRNVSVPWVHDSTLYGDFYWQTEGPAHLNSYYVFENNNEITNWPTNSAGSLNYMDWSQGQAGYDALMVLSWAKRMVVYNGSAACSYSANNVGTNCAVQDNRGEMWLYHGGPASWFGNILSSNGLTVTLRTDGTVDGQVVGIYNYRDPNSLYGGQAVPAWSQWNYNMLMITDGAGKGQVRHILDARTSTTVTIDRPWKVQPDSTSKAMITDLYRENVIYNNVLNAFPAGYVQTSSASTGITGSNMWGNVAEGNVSHRTGSGRSVDAQSGCPVYWNQFRDERAYDTHAGGFSISFVECNPVNSTILGNAFHGGEVNVADSTDGAGSIVGEGSVLEGVTMTSKRGFNLTGIAPGNWSGPQENRGWTLYRNCSIATIDGPANPSAMQPAYIAAVDDRQMLSGNTYSGASQTYWLGSGLSSYSLPVALSRVARFTGNVGFALDQVIVPIANAGIQSMTWTVTPSDSWITASIAANDSLSAESDMGRLVVSVNTSGMTAGRHWGFVDVTAAAKTVRVGVCVDLASGAPSNQPPAASFTASIVNGTAPLTVSFDAGASVDTDGSISSYYWSFGDGNYGGGPVASHTYSAQGTYVPVLTVTDNQGAQDTAYRIITVAPALTSVTLSGSPAPPVEANTPVTLTASAAGGYQTQYRFLIKSSSGWQVLRDYQSANTCTWTPSQAGYYEIKAQAKATDSVRVYDVSSDLLGYPVGLVPTGGMRLWLKADAGVTRDGSGLVSAWADQSGAGNSLVQDNPPYRPSAVDNVINGRPIVRFAGHSQALQSGGQVVSGPTAFSCFAALKFNSVPDGTYQYLWWNGGNTASSGYGAWISSFKKIRSGWGGSNYYVGATSVVVPGDWYRVSTVFAGGTGSNNHQMWINGTSIGTSTNTASNMTGGVFSVGNYGPDASQGFYGDIAEMIIYSRALSDTERLAVENYLGSRWAAMTAVSKDRLSEVKALGDGVFVNITSAKVAIVSSGVYSDGSVYVQESDRTCGMKIAGAGSVDLFDNLTLTGTTDTDVATGEKVLRVTGVTKGANTPLVSLGMQNKALFGSGLLVRVWGRVTSVTGSYLTIDDGSGSPVKVEIDGLVTPLSTIPTVGRYISAAGPAGCLAGGMVCVRVRSDSDIQAY